MSPQPSSQHIILRPGCKYRALSPSVVDDFLESRRSCQADTIKHYRRNLERLLAASPGELPGSLTLTVIGAATVFNDLSVFYHYCRDVHGLPTPILRLSYSARHVRRRSRRPGSGRVAQQDREIGTPTITPGDPPPPIPDNNRLEEEYDLEALNYAALLVLASATPDSEVPGNSIISNDALSRLRNALIDPYISDL